jgi:hypothetical protein
MIDEKIPFFKKKFSTTSAHSLYISLKAFFLLLSQLFPLFLLTTKQ